MKFIGSKRKIASKLLPIILLNRKPGQCYYEPFMGGCNLIDKVDGYRIGNDVHYELVEMFKALQRGWIPPDEISRETYKQIKANQKDYPPELVAFVGYCCSFGGKWWAGYAEDKWKRQYYPAEAHRNLIKQKPYIEGIEFSNCDYRECVIPGNSIIYYDPPYEKNNTSRPYSKKIGYSDFWEEVRKRSNQGHTVFVSEYNAPEDFECILEIPVNTTLHKTGSNDTIKRVEKLFKLKINR